MGEARDRGGLDEWFEVLAPLIQDEYVKQLLEERFKSSRLACFYILQAVDLPLSNLGRREAAAVTFLSLASFSLVLNSMALSGCSDVEDLAVLLQVQCHLISRVGRAREGFERRMMATRRMEYVQPQPRGGRGLLSFLRGGGGET